MDDQKRLELALIRALSGPDVPVPNKQEVAEIYDTTEKALDALFDDEDFVWESLSHRVFAKEGRLLMRREDQIKRLGALQEVHERLPEGEDFIDLKLAILQEARKQTAQLEWHREEEAVESEVGGDEVEVDIQAAIERVWGDGVERGG